MHVSISTPKHPGLVCPPQVQKAKELLLTAALLKWRKALCSFSAALAAEGQTQGMGVSASSAPLIPSAAQQPRDLSLCPAAAQALHSQGYDTPWAMREDKRDLNPSILSKGITVRFDFLWTD